MLRRAPSDQKIGQGILRGLPEKTAERGVWSSVMLRSAWTRRLRLCPQSF